MSPQTEAFVHYICVSCKVPWIIILSVVTSGTDAAKTLGHMMMPMDHGSTFCLFMAKLFQITLEVAPFQKKMITIQRLLDFVVVVST